jgi:hypothetical protein
MDSLISLDAPDDVKRAKVDELHQRLKAKGRGCGTCQACCTIMRVDMEPVAPTHKPERTRCGHLCSAGCKIYDAKPESCSVFMCLWLAMELFDDRMLSEWRPDRVGAVVDVNEVGTITVHLKHENRWMRQGPLREMLLWLAQGQSMFNQNVFVVLDRPSGNHLLFKANGSTQELVACGVGPDGLKQFRTKFEDEL